MSVPPLSVLSQDGSGPQQEEKPLLSDRRLYNFSHAHVTVHHNSVTVFLLPQQYLH